MGQIMFGSPVNVSLPLQEITERTRTQLNGGFLGQIGAQAVNGPNGKVKPQGRWFTGDRLLEQLTVGRRGFRLATAAAAWD